MIRQATKSKTRTMMMNAVRRTTNRTAAIKPWKKIDSQLPPVPGKPAPVEGSDGDATEVTGMPAWPVGLGVKVGVSVGVGVEVGVSVGVGVGVGVSVGVGVGVSVGVGDGVGVSVGVEVGGRVAVGGRGVDGTSVGGRVLVGRGGRVGAQVG
jgi:hypothetical protein